MKIYEEERPNGNTRFRVYFKDGRKDFRTREEAEQWVVLNSTNPETLEFLRDNANEVYFQLGRLKKVGASITDAVNFYLNHQPANPRQSLLAALTSYLTDRTAYKRSAVYLANTKKLVEQLIAQVGDIPVSSVTVDQVKALVFTTGITDVTIRNKLTILSVFFNWCTHLSRGYTKTNPASPENIERPRIITDTPKIVAPDVMRAILEKQVRRGWHDRLTVLVLVAFCGIRLEEACRLSWSNIDMERRTVEVPGGKAKKHRHRINEIPDNAMKWLELVRDCRRSKSIIGPKWKTLMRAATAGFGVPKNGIRHSFCSYWLGLHGRDKISSLIALMGHSGSPSVIQAHYLNVRGMEDGEKWFAIAP